MKRKLLTSYDLMRIAELNKFTQVVITGMDGNATFPNPSPTVADMEKLNDQYGAAINDAQNRDSVAIVKRNALQQQVLSALSAWATYANSLATGDANLLASTNLHLSKERTPSVLTMPAIEVLQSYSAGSMQVKVKDSKGALTYVYEYAQDMSNGGNWTSMNSSRRQLVLSGMEPGQQYWFRVVAIGTNNRQLASEPVPAIPMLRLAGKVA